MHLHKARTWALVSVAASVWLACAADSGDPSPAAPGVGSGSGGIAGSSSGPSSSRGSSSGTPAGSSGSSSSGGSTGSSSSSSSGGGSTGSGSSSGGSSSGPMGSSSSSGGIGASSSSSSGGSVVGIGSAGCAPTLAKSASVNYCANDVTPTTTGVTFNLALGNAGFSTINLVDVKVRYWFVAGTNPISGLQFNCDGAQNGNTQFQSGVVAKFFPAPPANVTPTSDAYMEASFPAAAGSLSFGGGATVALRFHSLNYQEMFTQTSNYSFDGKTKCPGPMPTQKITAYVQGNLVWGCEPQAGAGGTVGTDGGAPDGSAASSGGADAASGG